MNLALRSWAEETRRRRGGHLPGEVFSRGLLAGARLDPPAGRRAATATLVALVGDRRASVTFEAGRSYAILEEPRVNVDGTLVDAGTEAPRDVDELVVGVAAHEGGHLLLSQGPGRRPTPLRQWLYNLVEDERVEVQVARRWPALSSPLATTRDELLRSDPSQDSFLNALFHLVRAPDRMPRQLWSAHAARLERAIRILTPFPETSLDVARAIRRLTRLIPRDERRSVPPFPACALGDHAASGRGRARGPFARWQANEWSEHHPAVLWRDAPPDPSGYARLSPSVQADARGLRAAFLTGLRPRKEPAARQGTLDRRRLFAWRHDDRLFRASRPTPRDVVVVLILDLSGSMHSAFPLLQRIGVTLSEAVRGLRQVRLYVYGHAADGAGFPRTEIIRFATPACGPVLPLGALPHGGNNRDGHALELIARDLAVLEPSRRRARVAVHACDGDPSARGYCGLPAREATRKGIAAFRRSFGPLVLLGMGDGEALRSLGTPVVPCRDGRLGIDLLASLAPVLAAGS